MRRSELSAQDPALLAEVDAGCPVGYLTIVTPAGWPRSVALNFALLEGDVVFHGALEGEKFEALSAAPRAGFTMVKEYSFIPSTWSAPDHACPATHFFKSVEFRGTGRVVEDPAVKAAALQALMLKYQPEGGYRPIDAELPMYRGALRNVGVFRLETESWSGKVKFGQNEPRRLRETFVARLRERGAPVDLATADEIARTLAED